MEETVWCPTEGFASATRVADFMRMHGIATAAELRLRSTREPSWFWGMASRHLGVQWDHPWHKACDGAMPYAQWFVGGKINIVTNCVDRHAALRGEKIACHWESENGERRSMTYRELGRDVTRCATALHEAGIGKGDVVGMVMPICPEAVIIMFAAMKIGAVPMQPAARLGADMIVQLLADAHAKIVFTVDGYVYGGKTIDVRPTIRTIADAHPQMRIVVTMRMGFARALPNRVSEYFWADFMLRAGRKEPVQTLSLDAEDRALILYSSGTTGKPKSIVHVHGGMLVNTAKEVGYAFDCHTKDTFFWVTNLGWMMAPWEMIGVQFFGGTYVLYEGSPTYPTSHRLFEMIDRYRVSIFGFSPAGIKALDKNEDYSRHDLSSLRILGSTGAPLDADTWKWYFEVFGKKNCPIMNITGGTEIMGCLLSPLPIEPQIPGTVGGPGLGMAVDIVDVDGRCISFGEGTLICSAPFPSMTRGFLDGYEQFMETYFAPWAGLWNHHDRVRRDVRGFWFIMGRDDDLINRGGVKHDPMAIESALRSFSGDFQVTDAVAVSVPDDVLGQKIICFITVVSTGASPIDGSILERLRAYVGKMYDPSGKPDEIHVLRALPITLSAKVPRKKYVQAYQGEIPEDTASYAHGEVFADIAQLGAQ
ncbi:AMP-binding protein [Candidatus Kaiserbacteria bacterium]|nr:AMP-binding protein [Candidatus Kaiserbacteria bacterium]